MNEARKMNNKLIRLIAFMLVSLMLLFAVACDGGGNGDDSSDTLGNGNPDQSNPSGSEEVTFEASGLPEDLNYGNKVSILYWQDRLEPEFEVKEISLDQVMNAIYWRNQNTIKTLGLDEKEGLTWTAMKGNEKNMADFAKQVGASYAAGKGDYQIIAAYSRAAALCAINGYYADLAEIDGSYLDFSRRWWTPSLISNVTIDDSIYFVSGDISTNTIHMMYGIFCNTDMLKELKPQADPAQLAVDGDWTLDTFMGLCEGVYRDVNSNNKKDSGDRYGFVSKQSYTEAFYNGADLYLVDIDDTDVLKVSDDFTSVKTTTLVNKLIDFYQTIEVKGSGSPDNEFINQNALFAQNRMLHAQKYLSKVTFKYAVLPTPKYDDRQVGYRTAVDPNFTLWAVMKDVAKDEDMLVECSAVLECLAYEAYCNTTPKIFENGLKVKYSDDENINTVKCFDLIREGVVYDLGRIIPESELGGYMNEIFAQTIVGADAWSTEMNANRDLLKKNLAEIVKKIDKNKYGSGT